MKIQNSFSLNALMLIVFIACVTGCKKEPSYSLNKEAVTLTSSGTFQLSIEGGAAETFTYASDNSLVATIDANGLITGKRVGETTIKVSGNNFSGACTVSISPLYNTFKEPITQFGISKNEVKAKEIRTLLNETQTGLLFKGGTEETYAVYLFENNKYTAGCIMLSSSYSSVLGSYIAERYVIVSLSPIIGYSIDKKFAVNVELQSSLDWWVLYFPYTITSAKTSLITSKSLQFQSLLKQM